MLTVLPVHREYEITLDSCWTACWLCLALCPPIGSKWCCRIATEMHADYLMPFDFPQSAFIHTVDLPNLQVSVDQALTNFEPEILSLKSPMEWLHADANHINSVIQGIVTLTECAEIEQANFAGAMIYQVCWTLPGYSNVWSLTMGSASNCLHFCAPNALCKWRDVSTPNIFPVHHLTVFIDCSVNSRRPWGSGKTGTSSLQCRITS